MMSNSTNKPTTAFWVIGIIALLWNIMGVLAYIGQAYMSDAQLSLLPEGDQAYYANIPAWVTAAFAIAVFSGAFGCIGLLLKKKWANSLFMLSLLAVLAQFVYNFFIQDAVSMSGTRIIMPIVVILVAVFLVWYSKKSIADGYLS